MDKQTSDERLLKIIEGSSEGRRVQGTLREPKKSFGHPVAPKFNLETLKHVFKDLKLNLLKVNTALIGLGILLTLVFIFTLFSGPAISKSNAAYFVSADSASVAKFISTGEAQGLVRKSIDSESLRRNFFLPPSAKGADLSENRGVSLEELKGFKLVGIIWSDNPEVMIENTGDGRTYIFKKGESFNDQFKVKTILRNAAILEINSSNGAREYELR
ncbi:MAG: hypothetical protein WC543_00060 [Candidatus Omnitrophota bacterium]